MIHYRRLALPALLFLSACGDARSATDRIEVTEVDGVPTVRIDLLWDDTWPALEVRIDTLVAPADTERLSLVAPRLVSRFSDGRLLIGDEGTGRIWFEAAPDEWREGPGPEDGPSRIARIGAVHAGGGPDGEGFVVHDALTGRLVHFDRTGEPVDRVEVGSDRARHGQERPSGAWMPTMEPMADGAWLVTVVSSVDGPNADGVLSGTLDFVRVSGPDLDEEVVVGSGPAVPFGTDMGGAAPFPFANAARSAAAGNRIAIYAGEEPRVEVRDDRGERVLDLEWEDPVRTFGTPERERMMAYLREVGETNMQRPEDVDAWLEQLLGMLHLPDRLPPLGALRLSDDGRVWIGSPERVGLDLPMNPERLAEWRVVSPPDANGGVELYSVRLPEGVVTLLGPVGPTAPGDLFVLLRDDVDRQGVGILRSGPDQNRTR